MANFQGHWSFYRRHVHRQWGPTPTSPHYGGFSGYALPPPPYLSTIYQPGWVHSSPQFMPPGPSPPPSTPPLGTESVLLRLRTQIEYYFSEDNLARDVHLKMRMDEEGWVSVHTIAGFPRVKQLTSDVGLILRSLRPSSTVEVMGDKMRRRGTWWKWVIRR